MNKVLLVTWENYAQNRIRDVQILPERQANLLRDNYRASRRRRADVIPLNAESLKRFNS
jgi:hypothetical protein